MINTDPATIVRNKTVSEGAEKQRILEIANSPEARQLRVKLAAAYRIIARLGLDDGLAGHISLRVPGAPDYFWVNPFGKMFSEVTAENLVLVNKKGEIIDGWPMINQAGFCIHAAIHHARPDVNCAVHTHPPAGSAYSALAILLEPWIRQAARSSRITPSTSSTQASCSTSSRSNDIVAALGNKRALILANHGLLTTGGSVEQALLDMIDMERTCAVNLRAMSTGARYKSCRRRSPGKAARC